jgi:hypothetical protein
MSAASQLFSGILSSPPVDQINFWSSTLHISPDQFKKVAQALDRGKITVQSETNLAADAEYDPDDNCFHVLNFRPSDYQHVDSRGLLVHEAVHAIIDINKWDVTQISGEAAGYLAQVIYRKLSGDNLAPWAQQNASSDPLAAVFKKCLSIISSLNGTQSSTVSLVDCNELRSLVHRIPQYQAVTMTKKHKADGI